MKKTATLGALLLALALPLAAQAETVFAGEVTAGTTQVIAAPYGGLVEDVRVRVGDSVKIGDPIATVETSKTYASTDGTVSGVFAREGDSADGVKTQYGALVYIEPINRYTLECSTEKGYNSSENRYIHIGESVFLKCTKDGSHQGRGVVTGGGQLGIFEKNGVKVGMTGYCFPYKGGKKDISADVKALREAGCQIVIASFHWGSEYRDDFTGEQRTIGRAAIRAGADIVVGTHPHIVQGIEAYQDSYILYSLGNLVFGGNVDPDDRDAYLARVTFTVYEDHCDAPELTVVPIRLTALDKGTDYRPVVADEADSARIFKRIMKLSSGMGDFVNGELTEGL